MRLDELDQKIQDKLPFDVVDDVHFHMINDDAFYRKYYLPCISKIRSEKNEKIIQGHLDPMIHKCMNHYCLKYDIPRHPSKLLSDEETADLKTRIMDYERNPEKELTDAPKTDI